MNEFVTLVAEMRKHQQRFFSSMAGSRERQDALRESRKFEGLVDKKLLELTGKVSTQEKLF